MKIPGEAIIRPVHGNYTALSLLTESALLYKNENDLPFWDLGLLEGVEYFEIRKIVFLLTSGTGLPDKNSGRQDRPVQARPV